jgi:hypothetical protein
MSTARFALGNCSLKLNQFRVDIIQSIHDRLREIITAETTVPYVLQ